MAFGTTLWPLLKGAIPVVVLVALWLRFIKVTAPRYARRVLLDRFATDAAPDGPLTKCSVLLAGEEASTPALACATNAGWYMVSPDDAIARKSWTWNYPLLEHPVLIPWDVLKIGPAKFPFTWSWMRFDLPSAKATFFVQKQVAAQMLREAGRAAAKQ